MPTMINGIVIQDEAISTLAGSTSVPSGTSELNVTRLGAYFTGNGPESGEVFAYDKGEHRLFVMNNVTDTVEIVDFANPSAPAKIDEIDVTTFANYGGMNSLAVANGILAVAIESSTAGGSGIVAFYSTDTGALLNSVTVGVLPDMLVFSPDGTRLIVANEGERNGGLDPAGSISIVDLSGGVAVASVQSVGFAALDGNESDLRDAGVRITPGRSASTDIEPEYISLSADGLTAYVTLQEANSVAVVDVSGPTPVIQSIQPLGFVDFSLPGNEGDFSDRDAAGSADGAINLHNAPIRGLLMPDAIATFAVGNTTYFVTANEGDARSDDSDVVRLSTRDLNDSVFGASEADLLSEDNAGRLNVSSIDGDTDPTVAGLEEIVTFGGRGFTVFRANPDGTITKVDESGGEFSAILAAQAPTLFHNNQNNSSAGFDTRSDDKGPEPEAITVGRIGDQQYAFIGLERQGGIMVYNVSEPDDIKFVTYIAPFAQEDNGPEIIRYIAPQDSPNGRGLILTSNEISGSVTIYEVGSSQAPVDPVDPVDPPPVDPGPVGPGNPAFLTNSTPLEKIEALYIGYFGRAGEPGGVDFWNAQLTAGATFAQVASAFAIQNEAKSQHPYLANPNATPAAAFIESLYAQMFDRASDPSGLAYWVGQLNASKGDAAAIGLIIAQFISGASADDLIVLQNKVDASEYFTDALREAGITGVNASGQVLAAVDNASTDIIAGVDRYLNSVADAKDAADSFVDQYPQAIVVNTTGSAPGDAFGSL